jgi:cold shock CspA family protein
VFARLLPVALAACLLAVTAVAQNAPPTRIRGTIASLKDQTLTVKTREGSNVDVALNDPLTVTTVKKLTLADLKEGSYVGIATRTGKDGKPQAIEVLVFPEAMRGASEGHYPWDLEQGSMMTNANISAVVKAKSGRDLTLTYKDGTQQIEVPPNVPIVTFAPAQRSDLKPGARVMFGATKSADGKLTAGRVTVGTHGVNPPM